MKNLTWPCVVAALLAGSSSLSYAQDKNVLEGAYVTLGGGATRAKFKQDDFTPTDPSITQSVDDTDKGYKLSFGFKANRYLGFEIGHTTFGKFVHTYDNGSGATADVNFKAGGWWYSALGVIPLGRYFELFGRVGEIKMQASAEAQDAAGGMVGTLTAAGVPVSGTKGKMSTILGVGAQINFPGHLGMRLEYEDYGEAGDEFNTGRARLRMASASLMYRF